MMAVRLSFVPYFQRAETLKCITKTADIHIRKIIANVNIPGFGGR